MDRDDFDRRRRDALRAEAEANAYAEAVFAATWRGRALRAGSVTLEALKALLRAFWSLLAAFLDFMVSRVGLAALAAALLALVGLGLWRFEHLAEVHRSAPGPISESTKNEGRNGGYVLGKAAR